MQGPLSQTISFINLNNFALDVLHDDKDGINDFSTYYSAILNHAKITSRWLSHQIENDGDNDDVSVATCYIVGKRIITNSNKNNVITPVTCSFDIQTKHLLQEEHKNPDSYYFTLHSVLANASHDLSNLMIMPDPDDAPSQSEFDDQKAKGEATQQMLAYLANLGNEDKDENENENNKNKNRTLFNLDSIIIVDISGSCSINLSSLKQQQFSPNEKRDEDSDANNNVCISTTTISLEQLQAITARIKIQYCVRNLLQDLSLYSSSNKIPSTYPPKFCKTCASTGLFDDILNPNYRIEKVKTKLWYSCSVYELEQAQKEKWRRDEEANENEKAERTNQHVLNNSFYGCLLCPNEYFCSLHSDTSSLQNHHSCCGNNAGNNNNNSINEIQRRLHVPLRISQNLKHTDYDKREDFKKLLDHTFNSPFFAALVERFDHFREFSFIVFLRPEHLLSSSSSSNTSPTILTFQNLWSEAWNLANKMMAAISSSSSSSHNNNNNNMLQPAASGIYLETSAFMKSNAFARRKTLSWSQNKMSEALANRNNENNTTDAINDVNHMKSKNKIVICALRDCPERVIAEYCSAFTATTLLPIHVSDMHMNDETTCCDKIVSILIHEVRYQLQLGSDNNSKNNKSNDNQQKPRENEIVCLLVHPEHEKLIKEKIPQNFKSLFPNVVTVDVAGNNINASSISTSLVSPTISESFELAKKYYEIFHGPVEVMKNSAALILERLTELGIVSPADGESASPPLSSRGSSPAPNKKPSSIRFVGENNDTSNRRKNQKSNDDNDDIIDDEYAAALGLKKKTNVKKKTRKQLQHEEEERLAEQQRRIEEELAKNPPYLKDCIDDEIFVGLFPTSGSTASSQPPSSNTLVDNVDLPTKLQQLQISSLPKLATYKRSTWLRRLIAGQPPEKATGIFVSLQYAPMVHFSARSAIWDGLFYGGVRCLIDFTSTTITKSSSSSAANDKNSQILSLIPLLSPTGVFLVPSLWQQLRQQWSFMKNSCHQEDSEIFGDLLGNRVMIVGSGTAALSDDVRDWIKETVVNSSNSSSSISLRFKDSYGSTEIGATIASNGVIQEGVQVEIDENSIVWIKYPNMFDGFLVAAKQEKQSDDCGEDEKQLLSSPTASPTNKGNGRLKRRASFAKGDATDVLSKSFTPSKPKQQQQLSPNINNNIPNAPVVASYGKRRQSDLSSSMLAHNIDSNNKPEDPYDKCLREQATRRNTLKSTLLLEAGFHCSGDVGEWRRNPNKTNELQFSSSFSEQQQHDNDDDHEAEFDPQKFRVLVLLGRDSASNSKSAGKNSDNNNNTPKLSSGVFCRLDLIEGAALSVRPRYISQTFAHVFDSSFVVLVCYAPDYNSDADLNMLAKDVKKALVDFANNNNNNNSHVIHLHAHEVPLAVRCINKAPILSSSSSSPSSKLLFTCENGLLTPSMKHKRNLISEFLKPEIEIAVREVFDQIGNKNDDNFQKNDENSHYSPSLLQALQMSKIAAKLNVDVKSVRSTKYAKFLETSNYNNNNHVAKTKEFASTTNTKREEKQDFSLQVLSEDLRVWHPSIIPTASQIQKLEPAFIGPNCLKPIPVIPNVTNNSGNTSEGSSNDLEQNNRKSGAKSSNSSSSPKKQDAKATNSANNNNNIINGNQSCFNILLTGATGHVGAATLVNLLELQVHNLHEHQRKVEEEYETSQVGPKNNNETTNTKARSTSNSPSRRKSGGAAVVLATAKKRKSQFLQQRPMAVRSLNIVCLVREMPLPPHLRFPEQTQQHEVEGAETTESIQGTIAPFPKEGFDKTLRPEVVAALPPSHQQQQHQEMNNNEKATEPRSFAFSLGRAAREAIIQNAVSDINNNNNNNNEKNQKPVTPDVSLTPRLAPQQQQQRTHLHQEKESLSPTTSFTSTPAVSSLVISPHAYAVQRLKAALESYIPEKLKGHIRDAFDDHVKVILYNDDDEEEKLDSDDDENDEDDEKMETVSNATSGRTEKPSNSDNANGDALRKSKHGFSLEKQTKKQQKQLDKLEQILRKAIFEQPTTSNIASNKMQQPQQQQHTNLASSSSLLLPSCYDVVLHSAAHVDMVQSYQELRPPNVVFTQALASLFAEKCKKFILISTTSVNPMHQVMTSYYRNFFCHKDEEEAEERRVAMEEKKRLDQIAADEEEERRREEEEKIKARMKRRMKRRQEVEDEAAANGRSIHTPEKTGNNNSNNSGKPLTPTPPTTPPTPASPSSTKAKEGPQTSAMIAVVAAANSFTKADPIKEIEKLGQTIKLLPRLPQIESEMLAKEIMSLVASSTGGYALSKCLSEVAALAAFHEKRRKLAEQETQNVIEAAKAHAERAKLTRRADASYDDIVKQLKSGKGITTTTTTPVTSVTTTAPAPGKNSPSTTPLRRDISSGGATPQTNNNISNNNITSSPRGKSPTSSSSQLRQKVKVLTVEEELEEKSRLKPLTTLAEIEIVRIPFIWCHTETGRSNLKDTFHRFAVSVLLSRCVFSPVDDNDDYFWNFLCVDECAATLLQRIFAPPMQSASTLPLPPPLLSARVLTSSPEFKKTYTPRKIPSVKASIFHLRTCHQLFYRDFVEELKRMSVTTTATMANESNDKKDINSQCHDPFLMKALRISSQLGFSLKVLEYRKWWEVMFNNTRHVALPILPLVENFSQTNGPYFKRKKKISSVPEQKKNNIDDDDADGKNDNNDGHVELDGGKNRITLAVLNRNLSWLMEVVYELENNRKK